MEHSEWDKPDLGGYRAGFCSVKIMKKETHMTIFFPCLSGRRKWINQLESIGWYFPLPPNYPSPKHSIIKSCPFHIQTVPSSPSSLNPCCSYPCSGHCTLLPGPPRWSAYSHSLSLIISLLPSIQSKVFKCKLEQNPSMAAKTTMKYQLLQDPVSSSLWPLLQVHFLTHSSFTDCSVLWMPHTLCHQNTLAYAVCCLWCCSLPLFP